MLIALRWASADNQVPPISTSSGEFRPSGHDGMQVPGAADEAAVGDPSLHERADGPVRGVAQQPVDVGRGLVESVGDLGVAERAAVAAGRGRELGDVVGAHRFEDDVATGEAVELQSVHRRSLAWSASDRSIGFHESARGTVRR